jgi:hypothetical protein
MVVLLVTGREEGEAKDRHENPFPMKRKKQVYIPVII